MYTDTDTDTNTNTNTKTVFQISLPSGNYIINYRIGIRSTGRMYINLIKGCVNLTTNSNTGFIANSDFSHNLLDNNHGLFGIIVKDANYCLTHGYCSVTPNATTTYYVNISFRFFNYTVSDPDSKNSILTITDPMNSVGSYIYAIPV